MASSAGHPGPVSPETYWKRRVFVLAGLLVVVTLIIYACTRPFSSDPEETAGGADTDSSPEASSSPSVSPPPSPGDGPSASGSPKAGGTEDGNGDSGDGGDSGGSPDDSGRSGDGGDAIAAPEKPEDPCRPSDVVVALDIDKKDYAWDAEPEFEITAVNTTEQTCTVDLGKESTEVRITSGDDRIFSTADCAKGKGDTSTQLKRGVPENITFTWDRKRSWKDCRDADVSAKRPGTYIATLYSDYDVGDGKQVFRLN